MKNRLSTYIPYIATGNTPNGAANIPLSHYTRRVTLENRPVIEILSTTPWVNKKSFVTVTWSDATTADYLGRCHFIVDADGNLSDDKEVEKHNAPDGWEIPTPSQTRIWAGID